MMELYDSVEYKCDPYAFFIEKGLRIAKTMGFLAFITPVTWMTNYYYMKMRKLLIDSQSLFRIVLIDGLVFEKANVDTNLLFLKKNSVNSDVFEWSRATPSDLDVKPIKREYALVRQEDRYDITPGVIEKWQPVKSRMDKISRRLDSLSKISLGMKLRSNAEFISNKRDQNHPDPIVFGDNISRYGTIVPDRFFSSKVAVIVGGTKNPVIHAYKGKILIQAIRNLSLARRIVASYDSIGIHFVGTVNAVTTEMVDYDMRFILGIINSTLINYYFTQRFTTISLTAAFLGVIPIRNLDLSKHADKSRHDKMVQMVDSILDLHKRLVATMTDHEKKVIQRQIDTTDKQIDALVYELYGVTEEEIDIVEGTIDKMPGK
jgi:hypothetical protein